jgi:hypothetical protein
MRWILSLFVDTDVRCKRLLFCPIVQNKNRSKTCAKARRGYEKTFSNFEICHDTSFCH